MSKPLKIALLLLAATVFMLLAIIMAGTLWMCLLMVWLSLACVGIGGKVALSTSTPLPPSASTASSSTPSDNPWGPEYGPPPADWKPAGEQHRYGSPEDQPTGQGWDPADYGPRPEQPSGNRWVNDPRYGPPPPPQQPK